MSENEENENEKKKAGIEIRIDRSEEMQRMQDEMNKLRDDKAQLEATLEMVAEKELNARCRKYGISENLSDEEKLNLVEKYQDEHQTTAPLSEGQLTGKIPRERPESGNYGDWTQKEYDSKEEALRAIKSEAAKGNPEAQKALQKMVKEALSKNQTVELEGQISRYEFQGIGKPAKLIEKKKNPIFVPVEDKKEKD